jgi:hypothetical protein
VAISWKASVKEAAAKTVTVPVILEEIAETEGGSLLALVATSEVVLIVALAAAEPAILDAPRVPQAAMRYSAGVARITRREMTNRGG